MSTAGGNSGRPYAVPRISWKGRLSIPTGYIVGRVSPGQGDVELIPISELSQAQIAQGIVAPAYGGVPSSVGWFLRGPIQSSKAYYGATSPDAISFSNTAVHYAYAETAPGINYSLGIYLENTSSLIATVAWTGGTKTGTVTLASSPITVPAFGRLYVQNLTLADGNMRNATILLDGLL